MAHNHALILVSVTCLLLFPTTHQVQTSQTQYLLQLRKQLEYPKLLDSWDRAYDLCLTQPSSIVTVTCERESVTELKIIGAKLDRTIKFSGEAIPNQTLSENFVIDSFVTTLTRLPTLRVVILVSLGIWGPLPDKIHRLYSLEVLDLSSNFLFGSIPPKLSAVKGIQTLTLDNNYFNGSVPDWFGSFSNLTVLRLQNNRFKGQIPVSLTKITTLTEFSLSSNNISGKIPDLTGLISLKLLDLRDDELNSALPIMPKGIVTILLSKNSLTGEIPDQFTLLSRLQHLDLSYNFLVGTPPVGIFSLPNISYLNLASNMLSGSISDSLTCGNQLGFVDLSVNRLFGDLPACLSSNSDKRIVQFGGNCFNNGGSQNQHDAKYCGEGQNGKDSRKKGTALMVAVIVGIGIVIFFFSGVFLIICRRSCQRALAEQKLLQKSVQDNSTTGLSSELLANARYISQASKLGTQVLPTYRVFSVEELKEATNNFERSAFIGGGSIGKLYKGRLENGTFIAIRCLALLKRYSIRNLKLRLDLLAKLRNPNLVCLLGHCIDGSSDDSDVNRIFLVYEYVPNGTLRSYLFERNPERVINWGDRLQVLIGVAKAVHFLHTGIIPGSANNRIRTNSILLDEHFVAKLSDYGLSIITEEIYKREAMEDDQKFFLSYLSGVNRRDLEDDVYSFGLIIIEVLVRPTISGNGQIFVLRDLITLMSVQEERERVLDPIVMGTCSQDSLSIVISIASKCVSPEASTRPSVEEVLWNLQYAAQVQATADGDQLSEVTSQA